MHEGTRRRAARNCGIAAAIAALAMTGCGGDDSSGDATASGAPAKKSVKLAYLTKLGDNPYFVQEVNGAKAQAKALGADLVTQDLKQDSNAALSAVDTVISQGVKGIVMVPPDQKIGPAILQKAKAANVAVLSADDQLLDSGGKPAPFVGFRWAQIGGQVGVEAAKQYQSAGFTAADTRVASIELQQLPTCMDRNRGAEKTFRAAITDFPESNVLSIPYDGTEDKAISAMAATITKNPRVKNWVIWSCNDDGVLGAVRALEQAGVSKDRVVGVGLNANLACGEWKKDQKSALRSAIFTDSALVGGEAIKELYANVADKTPLPAEKLFDGVLVTPEDYQAKMKGYVGC